jgi:hypothetical protein
MTVYPHCRLTQKGKQRLHDKLNNLLILNAAIVIAENYLKEGDAKFAPGHVAEHDRSQHKLSAVLPVYGPLEIALEGKYPNRIQVDFVPSGPPALEFDIWSAGINKSPQVTFGFVAIVANIMGPIFVEFFEDYRRWVGDKFGHPDNWPPVWSFARVVRNSIAHGGRVNIENPNAKPVSWYGLSYSPADNGRRIIGVRYPDLSSGDLILMMFEMSDALDEAGCSL